MITAKSETSSAMDVSRRGFISGAAGLTFSFALSGGVIGGASEVFAAESAKLNAWVTIAADGTITILNPMAEMGQGTMTSLPLMFAEELDADWSKVKTAFAPPNPKVYGSPHPIMNGLQVTAASVSVPGYYMPLRIAGAQARRVLLDNAAKHWNVPVSELTTQPSVVVHAKTGRRLTYGEIAQFAEIPAELPQITPADLKKEANFRLIGRKDIGRVDVPSKTNGSAQYGMDVKVPGMVYVALLHSPMDGAKANVANMDEVAKVAGVTKVIPVPFGVAVFGSSVEATRMGREKLKVTWDTSGAKAANFDTEKAKAEYTASGLDPKVKPVEWFRVGDAPAAIKQVNKVVEATYWSEHTYHAQMEPMNCVANVAEDGKSAEIWIGTQSSSLAALVASRTLETTPDKIRVNLMMLGGGFGRRGAMDMVVQAVVLSKMAKQPVKLIYTREDDIAAARARPMTHHTVKAGLDAKGNIVGWHHRLVSESVLAVVAPPAYAAGNGRDILAMSGMQIEHYAIPNVLADVIREQRGMRLQSFRGIGDGYNIFVVESFLDEIAHSSGADPLAMRLALSKDHARANGVIKAAVEMSQWTRKRPKDRALGIAFSEYHGIYGAGVAEVSVDKSTGKIKVHEYWTAADAGRIIQPDSAHAQLEGSVVFGLGSALMEEFSVKGGVIQASNFNDYSVPRMSDIPIIHTQLVKSEAPPSGIGEIAVLQVAPAIGNAVFNLTGKRLRHLPMSPDRVKKAFV